MRLSAGVHWIAENVASIVDRDNGRNVEPGIGRNQSIEVHERDADLDKVPSLPC